MISSHNQKRYLVLLLSLAIILCACQQSTGNAEDTAKLQLTVQSSPDAFYQVNDSQTLENFSAGILFQGVENIVISLDGASLPLEDAVRQRKITPELLDYYCSTDAKNGLCVREQTSYHALNNKTFHYPDFSIRLVNDVLEAPGGAQYPVSYLAVFDHLGETSIVDDLWDPAAKTSATREDWGLDFSVALSDAVLQLQCTQSGGMQVGTLKIIECMVLDASGNPLALSESGDILMDIEGPVELKTNDTTNVLIDLNGKLPSESCYLSLGIEDCYVPSDIHPLIEKYHIYQTYQVPLP